MYHALFYHPQHPLALPSLEPQVFQTITANSHIVALDFVLNKRADILIGSLASDGGEWLLLASKIRQLGIPIPLIACIPEADTTLRRRAEELQILVLEVESFADRMVALAIYHITGISPDLLDAQSLQPSLSLSSESQEKNTIHPFLMPYSISSF
jgi:hypothetical protein